jgi:tetratricopeptide (TPR) repeat protein
MRAMKPSNVSSIRQALARNASRALLVSLALALSHAAARAQSRMPDPNEAYRLLMQRRAQESERAVTETQRRRFEEGKGSGTSFPSDANRASAKPGVVNAASPEERKALMHNERGLDLFSKNKFEQAVKEYNEAIRALPSLAAAHNNLGSALFAMGRFEEAAASFRQAAQLDPKYAQAHFNLALAYIKLGREREANDSLTSASRAYLDAGEEHLRENRLAEAEASFKGLLQIDPDYPLAHLKLGLLYNAAGRHEEAVASFNRVIAKQPDSADAYQNLAEAYIALRNYAEAARAAEQSVKLRPNSAAAHYVAGLAHASLGKRDQALAALDKLKELKADDYAKLLSEFIEKKAPAKQ